MDTLSYVTDYELTDKIKNSKEMAIDEKLQLRETILALNKEEQIELFKFLSDNLDYEFYSINGPKILFNMGSLTNDMLWKVQYHIKLLQEDTKRKGVIDEANAIYNEDVIKFNQTMENKLDLIPHVPSAEY